MLAHSSNFVRIAEVGAARFLSGHFLFAECAEVISLLVPVAPLNLQKRTVPRGPVCPGRAGSRMIAVAVCEQFHLSTCANSWEGRRNKVGQCLSSLDLKPAVQETRKAKHEVRMENLHAESIYERGSLYPSSFSASPAYTHTVVSGLRFGAHKDLRGHSGISGFIRMPERCHRAVSLSQPKIIHRLAY